jgi:SET domain-containing protein
MKKKEVEQKEINVSDLRKELKNAMAKELAMLPVLLKQIEPVHRLNILCKLMPYVITKAEVENDNDNDNDWGVFSV